MELYFKPQFNELLSSLRGSPLYYVIGATRNAALNNMEHKPESSTSAVAVYTDNVDACS